MVISNSLNSGKVSLEVIIDPYCPFLKYPAQEFSAEFNEYALNTVPEDVKRQVNFVKGVPGVYLREKYVYMHTFLEAPKKQDETDDGTPSEDENGNDAGAAGANGDNVPLDSQILYSHYWNQTVDAVEECSDQNTAINVEDVKDRRAYRREQTFVLTPHPLQAQDGSDLPDFGGIAFGNPNEQRWYYNSIDVPQDDTETGERADQQPTCKPLKVLLPGISNRSIDATKALHWKAEKKTPLFRGEDFVLEFKRNTESTDEAAINVTGDLAKSPFVDDGTENPLYRYLDVNAGIDQDDLSRSRTEFPPANNGVITYTVDVDEDDQNQLVYTPDENSKSQFNLHTQPYILVELGSSNSSAGGEDPFAEEYLDQQKYFIMITKNSNPTFLRIKGGTSFVLGQYGGISGSQLMSVPEFRMSVRNHLGKIIITFRGKENDPWIIDPVNISEDDIPMLTVPGAKIAVWSGNSAYSFGFFPLRYESRTRFTMPGNYKQHGQLLDFQGDTFLTGQNSNPVVLWMAQSATPSASAFVSTESLGYVPRADNLDNGAQLKLLYTSDANKIENQGISVRPYYLGRALLKAEIDDDAVTDSEVENAANIKAKSEIAFNVKLIRTIGNLYNIHQFVIQFALLAGAHVFPTPDDATELDQGNFVIANCKTPVLNQMRIISGDDTAAWPAKPLSLTDSQGRNYVEEFSDNWSASDYFRIEHTGSMRLLANKGLPLSDDIVALRDRAFYVIVNVKYTCQPSDNIQGINYGANSNDHPLPQLLRFGSQQGQVIDYDALNSGIVTLQGEFPIGQDPQDGDTVNISGTNSIDGDYVIDRIRTVSQTDTTITIEFSIEAEASLDDLVLGTINVYNEVPINLRTISTRLFTGLCVSSKLITGEGPEQHLDCQLKDFMYVLDNKFMLNSPFFDGMRDIFAVRELLRIGMMRSSSGIFESFVMPAHIISLAVDDVGDSNQSAVITSGIDNSRTSVMAPYILPQSYDRLTAAYYKFADGSKISDNIYELAKVASKIMYFDHWGVFRFENRKFDSQFFNDVNVSTDPNWYFTTRTGSTARGRLIYNAATREEVVSDVYNEIKIITSTPNGEAYIGANLDEYGIYGSPGSVPGWLGFKKTFLQFDGIFGSRQAVESMVDYYSRFFNPPKVINFETYGVPCRAGDIIRVQFKGNPAEQDYVIYNVSNSIKPKENLWWMQIEAEWLPTFGG